MSNAVHQMCTTVDPFSTFDSSNTGLHSTASEAAQHRQKLMRLRREFLSNGVYNEYQPLSALTRSSTQPAVEIVTPEPVRHESRETDEFVHVSVAPTPFDFCVPNQKELRSVSTSGAVGSADHLVVTTATTTTAVMTSSSSKGRTTSKSCVGHANECKAATVSTTITPGSNVRVNSAMQIETHKSPPLYQHVLANRSCATVLGDWSIPCNEAHRSTAGLVSNFSPIGLRKSPSSSSPPQSPIRPVTCRSYSLTDSSRFLMPHHPTIGHSKKLMNRSQHQHQSPRTYPNTPDDGSVSSGSRTHSTSIAEPNARRGISRNNKPSPPAENRNRTSLDWRIDTQPPPGHRTEEHLHKMHTTLRDFNAHLSQIDSTLGRMRSSGSLNQYLDSISDGETDLDEPEWNPRHTPSPPAAPQNNRQRPHVTTDRSSSQSDVGKSFECDTGVVTANRVLEPTGRHTATLSSSLGASLSTLSSSVWSSQSPSVRPVANGLIHPDIERYESDTHYGPSRIGLDRARKSLTSEHPPPPWSTDFQEHRYEVSGPHETPGTPSNAESWVRTTAHMDPLRFVNGLSSSPSYPPYRPPDPPLGEIIPRTAHPVSTKQAPLYTNWNGRNRRNLHVPKAAPMNVFIKPDLKPNHTQDPRSRDAFWTCSQPSLTSSGRVTRGASRSTNRTAYSITTADPEEAWKAINETGKSHSAATSNGFHGPKPQSFCSSSSLSSAGSSSSPSSISGSHSSRSGSYLSHTDHSRSVDSLIGQLSHLMRTGREDKARHVIGRLLDAPRSRRKLDSIVATLTTQSRVLDEQYGDNQDVNGDSDTASHVNMNDQRHGNSPTGSLLRLANSLIAAKTQRGLRKPTRGSMTSLIQSHSRPYDSEYVLSTPNLSEHTRVRTTTGQASASSRSGSLTSVGRSIVSSGHSRPHIPWCPDEGMEQPVPAMRPPPRPAPPCRPKATILPALHTLGQLDSRAIEIASEAPPASFTELVRMLITDVTDDVHIIRSLFIWTVTVASQPHEFDPTAPADSLIGMLRRIRSGQLSRNRLLHKLCRYAGVHCQLITGYAKGSAYRPGMPLRNNHMFYCAWLAVHVADGWRFINADCAVQEHTELRSSVSTSSIGTAAHSELHHLADSASLCQPDVCDEFYFLTDPEQHIFHSFPDHKVWQLLRKPISLERFVRLPLLRSAFFNANLALKKNYGDCLTTTNGQLSIKLLMPEFVGISCSLENCADRSVLRGLCLVEVLHTTDVVRIHVAPSQPGTYYLHIYVAPDWRVEDRRQLACSFQILCAEHNYSRLVVMGRIPEVGFLGPTPAARTLGVSMCAERSPSAGRALFVHTSSEPLRIPFAIAPGLKICHQLKSFDRPGHQMVDCDSYALLQMRPLKSVVTRGPVVNAYYHVRMPIEGFYYLTIYASSNADSDTDHLECVYRLLIDVRKTPPCPSAVPAFPRQTFWWVHCRLIEPLCQRLVVNRQYTFRLDAPQYDSVAVVINEADWYFLTPASPAGRWTGKVHVGEFLGQLSVFGRFSKGPNEFGHPSGLDAQTKASGGDQPQQEELDDDAYVKLLDYLLVE